jgi:predicted P-loop ATPase
VANKGPAPDWEVILERNKQGPHNNLDNVVRVIEHDPELRGHIWYDEFLDAVVSDWQDPARRWRDSDDILLQLYVQRHVGLTRIGANMAHDAALVAAFRNVRNECREWLEGLHWDGTPRLAYLLDEGFGAQRTTFTQAVGRCWFISMVARVMEPGCKVDTVPVLEGAQGVGKSSALKIIGGKWFAECHESVLTKDWYGVLDGHMLVEISEMHSFTRGEVERVKGLISCQVDRYRKAYGRNT